MDVNKMMQQVQQLQAQMEKAQEELANETVEASAGGGMVTVKATGALQITEIKISPEAIDPDDPEMLADMVLAAVNEALRSAQSLEQSKLGGMAGLGDLGGLGLRACSPTRRVETAPTRGVSGRAHRAAPLEGRRHRCESSADRKALRCSRAPPTSSACSFVRSRRASGEEHDRDAARLGHLGELWATPQPSSPGSMTSSKMRSGRSLRASAMLSSRQPPRSSRSPPIEVDAAEETDRALVVDDRTLCSRSLSTLMSRERFTS